MFYTLFGAYGHDIRTPDERVPLFIWLQGGPGSSSQFGAFTEIGPIRITKGTAKHFNQAWNAMGHVLFIDSPLNVGFSWQGDRQGKDQVSSTGQATDHLMNFLYNFYNENPALKISPLYITGESFAGHYIPNLAKKILANETFTRSTGITLAGVSIGDGWTDPINQINYYDSYLWSVGVVEKKFRDVCTWFQTHAIVNIYDGNYQNATNYFDFLTNNDTTPEVYMGNISIFNFRNYDGIDESFAAFLNTNKAEFGATVEYLPGNEAIYTAFGNDVSRSYASDVVTILRSIKVLIYNGQNDVVVNNAGVLQYLNSLNWENIGQWKRTQKQIWTRMGEVKGWAKVSGNLWFVMVNGAGHMVPTDQPEASFSMLGHFIHNEHDWKQ